MTPVHYPWVLIGNHTFLVTFLILGGKINLYRRCVHATLNRICLNLCQRPTTLGQLVKAFLNCLNVNQTENFLAVLSSTHKILTAPITWSLSSGVCIMKYKFLRIKCTKQLPTGFREGYTMLVHFSCTVSKQTLPHILKGCWRYNCASDQGRI
jgi:hypothetical protein